MRLPTSLPVIVALWVLGYAVAIGLMLGLFWLASLGGEQAMGIAILLALWLFALPSLIRGRVAIHGSLPFGPPERGEAGEPDRRTRQ